MRGADDQTNGMFSYLSPEQRVRADHPLRAIRAMTDRVFAELVAPLHAMYSDIGRPSIPPEQLLRALLIQSLYTVRSERLLMEEIDYSVLYRWLVGVSMDAPIWSPTTFTKNRDRLLESDIAGAFFDAVRRQADEAGLLSDEHFTVDGTLLEAWASLKSFRRKDAGPTPTPDDPGNPTVNFRGESRRNDTHQSTTDPGAQRHPGQGQSILRTNVRDATLAEALVATLPGPTTSCSGTTQWLVGPTGRGQTGARSICEYERHGLPARSLSPRGLGVVHERCDWARGV